MLKKTSNRILLAMLAVMCIYVSAQVIQFKMNSKELMPGEELPEDIVVVAASPEIQPFDKLSVNGAFVIDYSEGAAGLEIVAPELQRQHISVNQENGKLHIFNRNSFPDDQRIILRISGGPLKYLKLTENAILESQNLPQKEVLSINLQDRAQLNLKLSAKAVHLRAKNNTTVTLSPDSSLSYAYMFVQMGDNSKLDAAAVKVETIRTYLRNNGSVSIWPSGYLGSDMKDNSKASYKGNPAVYQDSKSSNELQKIEDQSQKLEK